MTDLVLTIIGRDRAGIVAALAEVVRLHGGNWKRSELAEIAGTFAGVVVVSVDDGRVDELLTELVIMREHGVHVTAQEIEEPTTGPADAEVRVRLAGTDRPGVVQDLSAALSSLGVNIVRMGTVTDLPDNRFDITARLALPDTVVLDSVIDAVHSVADGNDIAVEIDEIDDLDETDGG